MTRKLINKRTDLWTQPEQRDIGGWVLLRYGALLRWVTGLEFRGIEGGFGWWGGVVHLLELWVPAGLESMVNSSHKGSRLLDISVVPFRCMSVWESQHVKFSSLRILWKDFFKVKLSESSPVTFTNLPLAFLDFGGGLRQHLLDVVATLVPCVVCLT